MPGNSFHDSQDEWIHEQWVPVTVNELCYKVEETAGLHYTDSTATDRQAAKTEEEDIQHSQVFFSNSVIVL